MLFLHLSDLWSSVSHGRKKGFHCGCTSQVSEPGGPPPDHLSLLEYSFIGEQTVLVSAPSRLHFCVGWIVTIVTDCWSKPDQDWTHLRLIRSVRVCYNLVIWLIWEHGDINPTKLYWAINSKKKPSTLCIRLSVTDSWFFYGFNRNLNKYMVDNRLSQCTFQQYNQTFKWKPGYMNAGLQNKATV